MEKAIDLLNEVKESIINAYELRTNLSHAQLSHMMDETTWMNAKKAIELGFADGMLTDSKRSTLDTEAYAFSGRTVESVAFNKFAAKNAKPVKPAGRSVDELKKKLYDMKNYL